LDIKSVWRTSSLCVVNPHTLVSSRVPRFTYNMSDSEHEGVPSDRLSRVENVLDSIVDRLDLIRVAVDSNSDKLRACDGGLDALSRRVTKMAGTRPGDADLPGRANRVPHRRQFRIRWCV
jgi:hypothetical protein